MFNVMRDTILIEHLLRPGAARALAGAGGRGAGRGASHAAIARQMYANPTHAV